ncbi:MAG TPA: PfkB family carbohydrate kinase [Solirubrobacteraceae bacterium]|jgi:ribokinase
MGEPEPVRERESERVCEQTPEPVGEWKPETVRVAVVGHVEWVQFGRVSHVPRAGEVEHAREQFEEPAGGGAVAAVQLARLAGESLLLTAVGEDDLGDRSIARLSELGVRVAAVRRRAGTRRAVTLVDDRRERTIVTFGDRLEPVGADELPWGELEGMDAVYFTAGDLAALRAARTARTLVASPRARQALGHGVRLDALVLSEDDAIERRAAERAVDETDLLARTRGKHGGTFSTLTGAGSWEATKTPGDVADAYGCGDSFAAGLTYALGTGREPRDALELAARCGAMCLTGRGPYERQLTGREVAPMHL